MFNLCSVLEWSGSFNQDYFDINKFVIYKMVKAYSAIEWSGPFEI